MATGNSVQKAAIAADEITNKVPRTPVNSLFIRARQSARFSFVICTLCGMINFMSQRETFRDLSWYIASTNIFHGALHSLCLSTALHSLIYRVKDFNL